MYPNEVKITCNRQLFLYISYVVGLALNNSSSMFPNHSWTLCTTMQSVPIIYAYISEQNWNEGETVEAKNGFLWWIWSNREWVGGICALLPSAVLLPSDLLHKTSNPAACTNKLCMSTLSPFCQTHGTYSDNTHHRATRVHPHSSHKLGPMWQLWLSRPLTSLKVWHLHGSYQSVPCTK